jgi:hypothetical protein
MPSPILASVNSFSIPISPAAKMGFSLLKTELGYNLDSTIIFIDILSPNLYPNAAIYFYI